MKLPWFKRNGIFFLPTSIIGWMLLLAGLAFLIDFGIDLNNRSHSVSDFVRNLVFMGLIVGAIYSLIAYLTIVLTKRN